MSEILDQLVADAKQNPKANFTQYQLAISEVASSKNVNPAKAFAELRRIMEQRFGLLTLDLIIKYPNVEEQ